MAHTWVLMICASILFESACCQSYPIPGSDEHLYPYGPEEGDARLTDGDDVASPEIDITTNLVFFDREFSSLWVSALENVYL